MKRTYVEANEYQNSLSGFGDNRNVLVTFLDIDEDGRLDLMM